MEPTQPMSTGPTPPHAADALRRRRPAVGRRPSSTGEAPAAAAAARHRAARPGRHLLQAADARPAAEARPLHRASGSSARCCSASASSSSPCRALRALQDETGDTFTGDWSWVPVPDHVRRAAVRRGAGVAGAHGTRVREGVRMTRSEVDGARSSPARRRRQAGHPRRHRGQARRDPRRHRRHHRGRRGRGQDRPRASPASRSSSSRSCSGAGAGTRRAPSSRSGASDGDAAEAWPEAGTP